MEALMNSPRCTKAVRDKIWQDEEYAQDFLCVNLLINIGRMNTTLACEYTRRSGRIESPKQCAHSSRCLFLSLRTDADHPAMLSSSAILAEV